METRREKEFKVSSPIKGRRGDLLHVLQSRETPSGTSYCWSRSGAKSCSRYASLLHGITCDRSEGIFRNLPIGNR